ncbi:MAG: hypothetical protein IAG10_07705, partial [Planctomycetaceae bacterium]|nr:hypothetical protein [Planctomycetaceae bacterium]
GRQGLATICERNSDFLEAAKLYEASAATLAAATSVQDRIKHDVQLVKAATNYRLGKQPDRALRLLQSYEPIAATNSIVEGLHGYEMGLCHEALEEPQKALAAYLRTTEACPLIVPNTDIVQKIIKLGGVPLREDRDVDVKYVTGENNQRLRTTALATDGSRLFVGGVVPVKFNATGGRRFYGGVGVAAFDPDSRTWQSLNTDLEVTCLRIRDRELWVGTYDRGLWRYELDAKKWTSFGTDQGLPDLHVESIAFRANDVFVGVGSMAAGGLIRLDEQGKVHLFNGPNAPIVAPTHLVVTDKELLVRTLQTIHKWSWESKTWTLHPDEPNRLVAISSRLFAGANGVWASNYGRELTRWNADEQASQIFKPAWYFVPTVKAGYLVNFVAQHGDEVWFGGTAWSDFISSGLYRIHLKTGAFHKFTPADGFETTREHGISDGLWLGDRLWLATSSGLCVVTPRD